MELDWGLLVLGGGVTAYGVASLGRGLYLLNHGVITTGRVTDFIEKRSTGRDSQTMYYPVVSFMDLNGEEQTFQDTIGSSWEPELGNRVSVIYSPEAPDTAAIKSVLRLFFGPVVGLLLGIPAAATGLGMLME
jgi:hypothetical protein